MKNYSDLKIEWCGEILADIGYGVQARAILKPLIEGGADIKVIPAEEYVPESRKINDPFWLKVVEESKTKDERNLRVNFSIYPQHRLKPGAINVGYMLWETLRIPTDWTPLGNRLDYILTASKFGKIALESSGIKSPIKVVAPNLDIPPDDLEPLTISEIPENSVKFLFSGNWVPRKNHADLITAFNIAFGNVPDAALIIKCWPQGDESGHRRNIEAGVRHFLDRMRGVPRAKIHLIADYMSTEKVNRLIKYCDIYASASKAEGFDTASLTAMAMGKLTIGVPYGIKADYLNEMTSLPVVSSLEPIVDSMVPGYDAYQAWARPNMESLIYQLQVAYQMVKNPDFKPHPALSLNRASIQSNGKSRVLELYSAQNNTDRIYDALKEIINEATNKSKGIKSAPKVVQTNT